MKKRIISICAVSLLIAIMIIGAAFAFMTDGEEAVNTFTVGNVQIKLTEEQWDNAGYNKNSPTVVPGGTYAKDPAIENTGKNAAWVRMNLTISDYEAFAEAMGNHNITDLSQVFSGYKEDKWTRCGDPIVARDSITYSYYYNIILDKGTSTEPIFESVTIPGVFTSEEMDKLGSDFTIKITADAIQAEGFDTVKQAFAAFDEQVH